MRSMSREGVPEDEVLACLRDTAAPTSCLHSLIARQHRKSPKFIEPMLSEHSSGLSRSGAAQALVDASSSGAPPVVMLMTASVACLICGRNCGEHARDPASAGRPSDRARAGERSRRPPRRRRSRGSAISSGVIGRYGDIDGVWIAPVTAQVMMTLSGTLPWGSLRCSVQPRRAAFRRPAAAPAGGCRWPQRYSTLPSTLTAWPVTLRAAGEHR